MCISGGDDRPQSGLEALRALIADDLVFARELRALPAADFIGAAVRAAAVRGLLVSDADLRAAIAAGSAAWLMRWLR